MTMTMTNDRGPRYRERDRGTRQKMTKSSADVIESSKAPTSERAPKGPRTSDLEGPSLRVKRSKRPRASVKSDRVRPRKTPKEKRGRRREPESADVRESSKKTVDLGPRRTESESKETKETTDLGQKDPSSE